MPISLLLLGLFTLSEVPPIANVPAITPGERKAFEAERAGAANDASRLIRLALWAESKGLDSDRTALLKDAAAADPNRRAALGLLGLMAHGGSLKSPDEVAKQIRQEEARAKNRAGYTDRRDRLNLAEDADRKRVGKLKNEGRSIEAREVQGRINHRLAKAHLELGDWCKSRGMKPEAIAHFTSSVVLDPHLEPAWKQLGCVKHNGRWMSHDQIIAERQRISAQHEADRHWGPLLALWKTWLTQDSRRSKAREELDKVDDPLALPSILKTFVASNPGHQDEWDQIVAVQFMGRIATPASTRNLAILAVLTKFPTVRSGAAEILRARDPRDYAEMLVKEIHSAWSYRLTTGRGPGASQQLIVDSPRFCLVRQFDIPVPFKLDSDFHGYVGIDPTGLPVVISGSALTRIRSDFENPNRRSWAALELSQAEERTSSMIATAQMEGEIRWREMRADISAVDSHNARAAALNSRIRAVLERAMDAPAGLGNDEGAWNSWYYDRIGYRYTPPPKVTYRQSYPQFPTPTITSCFAAGTPVRSIDGHRKIETLMVGDRVLCQDVNDGNLSYQPILVVHRNPPDKTVVVTRDDGDRTVASRYHRFWMAGRGWVMARDLKVGDVLRTLGGLSRVRSVAPGPVVPVFNLDVAGGRTFFVGDHDALVHDNTMPARVEVAFDAMTEIMPTDIPEP